MYRYIPIPADGSELSQKTVGYGIALEKPVNAKVTVMTASTPFHAFAAEPGMIADTPEQYSNRMAALTTKCFNVVKEAELFNSRVSSRRV